MRMSYRACVRRGVWVPLFDGLKRVRVFRKLLHQRLVRIDFSPRHCICTAMGIRVGRSGSLFCGDSLLGKNRACTSTTQLLTNHPACMEAGIDMSAPVYPPLAVRLNIFRSMPLSLLLPLLSLALASSSTQSTALNCGFVKRTISHCNSFAALRSRLTLCHRLPFSASMFSDVTRKSPFHLESATHIRGGTCAACEKSSFPAPAARAAGAFPTSSIAPRMASSVFLVRAASSAPAATLSSVATTSAPDTGFACPPCLSTTSPVSETATYSNERASRVSATAAALRGVPGSAVLACFARLCSLMCWPVGLIFAGAAKVNAVPARDAASAPQSTLIANAGQPGAAKATTISSGATAGKNVTPAQKPVGWVTDLSPAIASGLTRGAWQQEEQKQPQRQRKGLFFGEYASRVSDREDVEGGNGRVAPGFLHLSATARCTAPSRASPVAGRAGQGSAYGCRSAVEAKSAATAAVGPSGASGEERVSSFPSSSVAGGFSFLLPKGGGVVSSNDLRTGSCVVVNRQPYRVLQFQSVKMARAAAYVRARLKNLLTGATIDHSFRSDEKLQIPEITVVNGTFSSVRPAARGRSSSSDATAAVRGRGRGESGGEAVTTGNNDFKGGAYNTTHRGTAVAVADGRKGREKVLVFLNTETWEEVLVSDRDIVERIGSFLQEGMEVKLGIWEDKILDVALPPTATYVVSEVSGSRPEQRGNPSRKQAILETGARISVPHFVCEGDRIVVRTNTGDFVKRL